MFSLVRALNTAAGTVGLGVNAASAALADGVSGLNAQKLGGHALTTGEETADRRLWNVDGIGGGNGFLKLTYFTARKSENINTLKWSSGQNGHTGATLLRVGVYSVAANGDLTLVASTVNDVTLATTGYAVQTKALSSTWAKVAGQRYAIGILGVGASTAAKWMGTSIITSAFANLAPRISGNIAGQANLGASYTAGQVADDGTAVQYILS